LAYVTLSGKPTYLGPHGSKESRDAYDRIIGEWLVGGRTAPQVRNDLPLLGMTITSLIAAFWTHAESYYPAEPVSPGMRPSGELGNYWDVLKPLNRLYGPTAAQSFGPRALKTIREEMIRLGWCRNTVNRRISRIKAVFKWAVANELIPPSVYHGLSTVDGLRRGRGGALESEPVKPVKDEHFAATLPFLSRHLRAMVELQLLTGMRPGEVLTMRGCEIDTRGDVWLYTPAQHKTMHLGHERVIRIGPKAAAVLEPFLQGDTEAFVFSPADAVAEQRAARSAARKTPVSCGNKPGSNRVRSPRRRPREMYDKRSYGRAITRACDATDRWSKGGRIIGNDERLVPRWHPHQLRHNAATLLRRLYGIDAARTVLGHRTIATTEIYAELDQEKAERVMKEIG
jgi:integrase